MTLIAPLVAASLYAADPMLPPGIHDWTIRYSIIPGSPIIPTPLPGWDLPAHSQTYQNLYASLVEADMPVGLMLVNGTAPITGWKDPNALYTTLGLVPRLDYCFADIETSFAVINLIEMVYAVRLHPDPNISSAWIGAYSWYPGEYDESFPAPANAYRSFDSIFYLTTGFDVAMPNAYPYSAYQVHTWPNVWGDYLAPNVRSALFWAPIHKTSVAKLSLPDTHGLIPWISPFVFNEAYGPADPPPLEDRIALLQHLRLRGSTGYYLLFSYLPDYPNEQYRADMLATWTGMDWIFDGSPTEILNLATDKLSGVQWSGVKRGDLVVVLVSNLGEQEIVFELPPADWPGFSTVTVPAGTHLLVSSDGTYEPPLERESSADLDGSGVVDAADLGLLLAAWGPCPPRSDCPADLDGSGAVDAIDLGQLLAAWN